MDIWLLVTPLWGYCTLLPMARLTGALYVSSHSVSAQGLAGWREWPVLLWEGGTLDAGRRTWAQGQESGRGPDTLAASPHSVPYKFCARGLTLQTLVFSSVKMEMTLAGL